jgi:hypothetical protein
LTKKGPYKGDFPRKTGTAIEHERAITERD